MLMARSTTAGARMSSMGSVIPDKILPAGLFRLNGLRLRRQYRFRLDSGLFVQKPFRPRLSHYAPVTAQDRIKMQDRIKISH
jgi:hypothetical protein